MKEYIKTNKTKILNISFIMICVCYVLTYLSGMGESGVFMAFSSAVLFAASALAAVL